MDELGALAPGNQLCHHTLTNLSAKEKQAMISHSCLAIMCMQDV